MRITTSNALLALSAAAISAASVDAFVPPVPQMVAPGRGAKDLTASKPRVSRPLASRLDMQVSPDKRAKDAKGRGGAAAPLGAVAMPASGRVPVAPRVVTSDAGKQPDICTHLQTVSRKNYKLSPRCLTSVLFKPRGKPCIQYTIIRR